MSEGDEKLILNSKDDLDRCMKTVWFDLAMNFTSILYILILYKKRYINPFFQDHLLFFQIDFIIYHITTLAFNVIYLSTTRISMQYHP